MAGRALTWEELQDLPNAELIRLYNEAAKTTGVGIDHHRDALIWRYQKRQTDVMVRLTWGISGMTAVVVVATVINVVLFAVGR